MSSSYASVYPSCLPWRPSPVSSIKMRSSCMQQQENFLILWSAWGFLGPLLCSAPGQFSRAAPGQCKTLHCPLCWHHWLVPGLQHSAVPALVLPLWNHTGWGSTGCWGQFFPLPSRPGRPAGCWVPAQAEFPQLHFPSSGFPQKGLKSSCE